MGRHWQYIKFGLVLRDSPRGFERNFLERGDTRKGSGGGDFAEGAHELDLAAHEPLRVL